MNKRQRDVRGPFNSLISQHMQQRGWRTVEAFSIAAGLSPRETINLLRGRGLKSWTRPTPEVLERLALAVDVPLATLREQLEH